MIVAESVGFSATHTVAAILGALDSHEVAHGSQDFAAKARIGSGRQAPDSFAEAMARSAAAGRRPVAIHTLFPPAALKPACEARGIAYRLLVRAPEKQIESCYAWILGKVLRGDPVIETVLAQALPALQRKRLAPSLQNLLYLYAARHVTLYNAAAMGLGAGIVRAEEVLADEAGFRALFAVPETEPLDHFAGTPVTLASHRAKLPEGAVAAPERDAILDGLKIEIAGHRVDFAAYRAALGY